MSCRTTALLATFILAAHAATAQPLIDALRDGKPVVDLRARSETVSDDGKARDASAQTLRARLGYATAPWHGLQLTAEMDAIVAADGTSYNSTRNGRTAYPVIADPALLALNQLQLRYAPDADTAFTLGRQRLTIGNQRFVGNVGWRQHEQTFDALSFTNTSLPGLSWTYAYLYRVNRIGGPATPNPAVTPAAATAQASYFKSNSHILDGVYTGLPSLRLEGYVFLLDLSAPGYARLAAQQAATARLSTATYGARAEYGGALLEEVTGKITGEYARQTDYGANPLSFALDYWLAEASLGWNGITGTAGYEILEGNGTIGFSTPLATLHAFNGWADMFLATPANGLKDRYIKLAYAPPASLTFDRKLTLALTYHDFQADRTSRGIGSEWDVQAEWAIAPKIGLLAKYASYAGSGIGAGGFPDKSIFWLQTAYSY